MASIALRYPQYGRFAPAMTRLRGDEVSARATPAEAIVLGPGEGRVIPGPEGVTVRATGEQTGGAIGFLEATSPSGFGAPRHIHHTCDELFYVLAGEFEFLAGERI